MVANLCDFYLTVGKHNDDSWNDPTRSTTVVTDQFSDIKHKL